MGLFGDSVGFFFSKSFVLNRFLVELGGKLDSMYKRILSRNIGFDSVFRGFDRFFSYWIYGGHYELVYSVL